jgi:2-amino-4-hydroxy-6-hydroxymethyldihydropteridine diphosphokinase
MPRAAIALGSNLASKLDDREGNLRMAIDRVGELGRVVAVSGLYDTEPVGFLEQPRFLNAAMLLETSLGPVELLRRMLEIERGMGRDREHVPAKGPRVIDLDLLLYEDRILELPELTLPHPAMHERRFVLEPLNEIAPNWWHPRVGLTVAEMLARLPKT